MKDPSYHREAGADDQEIGERVIKREIMAIHRECVALLRVGTKARDVAKVTKNMCKVIDIVLGWRRKIAASSAYMDVQNVTPTAQSTGKPSIRC